MPNDLQAWLALVGPAVIIVVSVVGGLYKVLAGISHRIKSIDDKLDLRVSTLDEKLDRQTTELKENVNDLYNTHEARDQDRHIENVQRFTRLETLVNNGKWNNTFRASGS